MSQTCYTAGFTGTSELHGSSNGGIFVNEAPAHRVPCDGTVYAWHYCYYDTQSENDLEVAFGAYQAIYDGDEIDGYELRDGSYRLLHLDSRETNFTCDTVYLEEAAYFQIYVDDRLGACLRNNDESNSEFLDILAEGARNSLRIRRLGSSSGQCLESDMSQSSGDFDSSSGMVLHLSVDISKSELIQSTC